MATTRVGRAAVRGNRWGGDPGPAGWLHLAAGAIPVVLLVLASAGLAALRLARRKVLRWRAANAAIILTLSSFVMAPPVQAMPYDGTNPGATPCGDGSHPVTILDTAIIYGGNGNRIGRVELRQSAYCATVWSRVYNETSSTRDLR
jgi:hypothetical protein